MKPLYRSAVTLTFLTIIGIVISVLFVAMKRLHIESWFFFNPSVIIGFLSGFLLVSIISLGNIHHMRRRIAKGILTDLGIARAAFAEVLSDFCSDVAGQLPASDGGYQIGPTALGGMLDEVSDPTVREKLLRHMLVVINSDGHLSDAEKNLICNTIEHWQPRLAGGSRMPGADLHVG